MVLVTGAYLFHADQVRRETDALARDARYASALEALSNAELEAVEAQNDAKDLEDALTAAARRLEDAKASLSSAEAVLERARMDAADTAARLELMDAESANIGEVESVAQRELAELSRELNALSDAESVAREHLRRAEEEVAAAMSAAVAEEGGVLPPVSEQELASARVRAAAAAARHREVSERVALVANRVRSRQEILRTIAQATESLDFRRSKVRADFEAAREEEDLARIGLGRESELEAAALKEYRDIERLAKEARLRVEAVRTKVQEATAELEALE